MNNFCTKLLSWIDYILAKLNSLSYKEYYLKLEDCYYDRKKSTYVVVLRFRNKNAVIKSAITDVTQNKNLISSLHPCDSYIIGVVKTMQENGYITNKPLVERDFEDYYVIEPCVDWIGTDLTENKLIFKAKSSIAEIKISIEEFCKNFKLMCALSARNTFLIGSVVGSSYIQGAM